MQRQPGLSILFAVTSTLVHLKLKHLVRPHLEYASAAWDPFTARDITQLDKVQRRSARFDKNNYKWSQSVSQLTSELGWQPLDQRRKNARHDSVLQK